MAATARSRGYAAGYADGRRAAAAEQQRWLARAEEARRSEVAASAADVSASVATLHAAARALREATLPVLAEAEHALIDMAFELAEAVVGVALADDLAAARAAVARVLDADGGGAVAVIRLNPGDADLVAATADALTARDVRIVPDPSVARGDAVGELPGGWLDAGITAAFERAKEALS